jgi:U32 family peptidase
VTHTLAHNATARRGLSGHGPELLAPAGDWECARAAVENGADAIYFGLDQFNARMRAHNFSVADLPELMRFLHRRGVKGYVTFNILVFPQEMAAADEYLRAIIASGVDAAIVQDVGICRLIRRISPDFPLHASTQMTVSSAAGLRFVRDLGCSLVALARECSLKEIGQMRTEMAAEPCVAPGTEPPPDMPLEIFVHGALCVAYSGQCLTSESLGGRSANRGVCAQACRLPYDLIRDGRAIPLGDKRYLLSPRDLAGLEALPEIVQSGVATLKIEGRLKSPEYVANITRVYRQALDKFAALKAGPSAAPEAGAALTRQLIEEHGYEMEMAFSRGLYTGWLRGVNNRELVHARFGKKRGVYLGDVRRVRNNRVALRLEAPLKLGDGVVFDAGRPDLDEEGGRVYGLQRQGDETWLEFGRDDIQFEQIHVGDMIWKTSDPELDRRLRQTYAGDRPQSQRPVVLEVHGAEGTPLTVLVKDEAGRLLRAESEIPLAKADKHPLNDETLRAQFGRLGGTPFYLERLQNQLEGPVILPVSELNRLRRDWVKRLEQARMEPLRWTMVEARPNESLAAIAPVTGEAAGSAAELIVLARSMEQLDAALKCGVRTIYCELEDIKRYPEAVRKVHEAGACADPGRGIWLAPPRITKPGERWMLRQVQEANPDGFLMRNYDHLEFFAGKPGVADFSFNIANALSAEYFLNRYQLNRVAISYDLNIAEVESLLRSAPPAWFEIVLHQHMPLFHMEHCVFCAFMSDGTDFTNCGRPCEKHEVRLRDRVGVEHPVKADAGCRNTVYNGRAQTGADGLAQFLKLGANRFRVELLAESAAETVLIVTRYRQLLRGEITAAQLVKELKLINSLGVTRGPK